MQKLLAEDAVYTRRRDVRRNISFVLLLFTAFTALLRGHREELFSALRFLLVAHLSYPIES